MGIAPLASFPEILESMTEARRMCVILLQIDLPILQRILALIRQIEERLTLNFVQKVSVVGY
jgi:hypothetical protein